MNALTDANSSQSSRNNGTSTKCDDVRRKKTFSIDSLLSMGNPHDMVGDGFGAGGRDNVGEETSGGGALAIKTESPDPNEDSGRIVFGAA